MKVRHIKRRTVAAMLSTVVIQIRWYCGPDMARSMALIRNKSEFALRVLRARLKEFA